MQKINQSVLSFWLKICETQSVMSCRSHKLFNFYLFVVDIKQLLDEVEYDIMNYQNRGLCYLPKPKASADNTDTRF